eukprot:m.275342 g.275342  ORF g.275342 m.275342 type:complete len:445 (+) comp16293_c0_seq16:100-1434(+)
MIALRCLQTNIILMCVFSLASCCSWDPILLELACTAEDLTEVPTLDKTAKDISLNQNKITTIYVDDFTGLRDLQALDLGENGLSKLEAGCFNELSNLEILDLNTNKLKTLPNKIFAKLTNLKLLDMNSNILQSLRASVFQNLNVLEDLYISANRLTSLPSGILDSVPKLTFLGNSNNGLEKMPANIFDKLIEVHDLEWEGNAISCTDIKLTSCKCKEKTISLYNDGEYVYCTDKPPVTKSATTRTNTDTVTSLTSTYTTSTLVTDTSTITSTTLTMLSDTTETTSVTDEKSQDFTTTLPPSASFTSPVSETITITTSTSSLSAVPLKSEETDRSEVFRVGTLVAGILAGLVLLAVVVVAWDLRRRRGANATRPAIHLNRLNGQAEYKETEKVEMPVYDDFAVDISKGSTEGHYLVPRSVSETAGDYQEAKAANMDDEIQMDVYV